MICLQIASLNPVMQRMCKIKRHFALKKCTFARFKSSHFDQTRRRKAGFIRQSCIVYLFCSDT